MKPNKRDIRYIKDLIGVKLEDVPDNFKIKLDKEILELLLFDKYDVIMKDKKSNSTKRMTIKMISSDIPFPLSKIDLSEVSFDGVCWSDEGLDQCICEVFGNNVESMRRIGIKDFSHTNANIDFSQALAVEDNGHDVVHVNGYKFSFTDLSNNLISGYYSFKNCDLSNTGIRFDFDEHYGRILLGTCNLENNDFSDQTIDAKAFVEETYDDPRTVRIYNTNLRNTKLRIKYIGYACMPQDFCDMFRSGKLYNCYINDDMVKRHSPEEIANIKEEMKVKYGKYMQELTSKIEHDIDKQKEFIKK